MIKSPVKALGIVFGMVVLTACSRMKEPEFRSIENFNIEKASIESSDVSLDVRLFNPNDFGVKLKETVSDFYVDSIYLGKLTQDSAISVAANSSFVIPLKGKVQLRKLLKNGMALLLNNEVLIKAEGSTRVGKAGVFMNFPFHYQGRQSLNFLR